MSRVGFLSDWLDWHVGGEHTPGTGDRHYSKMFANSCELGDGRVTAAVWQDDVCVQMHEGRFFDRAVRWAVRVQGSLLCDGLEETTVHLNR